MDEEIERLVVSVRADTAAFARDVGDMRNTLEGPLGAGVQRAGQLIETTLARAIRTGKLGFDDLAKVALAALAEIATAVLRSGLESIGVGGSGGSGGGGLLGAIAGIIGGAPGRATGGPVSPGRAYRIGERGPELFVPTTSGRVIAAGGGGGGTRDVRIAITVNGGGAAPEALARSGRQVARAVKVALAEAD